MTSGSQHIDHDYVPVAPEAITWMKCVRHACRGAEKDYGKATDHRDVDESESIK